MVHPLLHATLSTSSQSLSSTSLVLFSSTHSPTQGLLFTHPSIHCEDPRQDGTSAEYQPLKGYIDTSSLRFGREPNNYVRCWLHHCRPKHRGNQMQKVYRSEKANALRAQAYHSRRESLKPSSSRDLEVSGQPDAVSSCHSESFHSFCF